VKTSKDILGKKTLKNSRFCITSAGWAAVLQARLEWWITQYCEREL